MSEMRKWLMFLGLLVLVVGSDIATKRWADATLRTIPLESDRYSWLGGHLRLRLAHNTGVAFGMFGDHEHSRWILTALGIAVLGVLFYFLRREEADHPLFLSGLAMVAGGAIGNLWDRIVYGHVTDFIQVWITPAIKILWPWPNFNIADMALLAGIALMLLYTWLYPPKEEGKEAAGE